MTESAAPARSAPALFIRKHQTCAFKRDTCTIDIDPVELAIEPELLDLYTYMCYIYFYRMQLAPLTRGILCISAQHMHAELEALLIKRNRAYTYA